MNKHELKVMYLKFLKDTGLRVEEVALGFGGALVMMGLRDETSDLDLDIPEWRYQLFKVNEYPIHTTPIGECMDYNEFISVHRSTSQDCVYIEGVRVYSPMLLLESKRFLSTHPDRKQTKKAQDLIDIERLRTYIVNQ